MNEISIKIARWYDLNKRDLPWRNTQDAYKIWLSEIILQQTRVNQGYDYYLRFTQAFPTVADLANATEDQVLKLWQGLGYYSRARNLHTAAQQVMSLFGGRFPTQYDQLIKLKGVGPYTAAAIASFSSDEQVAVVDGNVYRVLSRLFDVTTPIDTGAGQKEFQQLADQLLITPSSHHNQAMMEFGALYCTPSSPNCQSCPIADHCLSHAQQNVEQRPVKQGKTKIRERYFAYLIYIYKETLWVHQRGEGDIWQGLWEFVIQEDTKEYDITKRHPNATLLLQRKHQLSHQTLHANFWVIKLDDELPEDNISIQDLPDGYQQMSWMEWQQKAVPRLIDEANKRLSDWF